MKGTWFMLFLLSACCTGFIAQSRAESPQGIFPYTYHEKTLDNKLKVIMIPMDSPGLVSFYSIVRTGSRDEFEPGHTGFAHFFEHMMFRGTKKYPGNVYDKMMTEMGADGNAYTTDDYTCYHLSFAREDLDKVLDLESDRFQNLFYTEQDFKTEAGAVHGEYLKGLTSPWAHLFENLLKTAFTKHTYRHRVIGFKKDIEAMPTMYEYSLNFHKRYYRPENTILLMTGDIDLQKDLEKIKSFYGPWKTGYVKPEIPKEPEQKKERNVNITYDGKTLPIVTVSYKSPVFDASNKDVAANLLFSDMAFGPTSEIYKKLVINEQRVQFIEMGVGINRDPNLMTVYTMVQDPADIDNIIREIDNTIAYFQNNLVDEQALDKQRSHNKYEFLMNLDTPEKTASRLARFLAVTGDMGCINTLYNTFDQITPQDIQRASQVYMDKNKRTIAVLRGGK